MDTNIKFSHKNQIKSYEKYPHQPFKYSKENLNNKLIFLFSLLEDNNYHKNNAKKEGCVVVVKQLIPMPNKSEIRLGEVEGHDYTTYTTVQLCSYVDFI